MNTKSVLSLEEFCSIFSTDDEWLRRGWQKLPSFDGSGIKNWTSLCAALTESGKSSIVAPSGDWLNEALEVENQELFVVNDEFGRKLEGAVSTKEIESLWDVTVNGGEKGASARIITHDEPDFQNTTAWNFSLEHLSSFRVPSSLQYRVVAGIFGTGKWFTDAHVETCGDDSIACVLFGKKVFLYAKGRTISRWLTRSMKTSQSFISWACRGPPPGWENKLFYCLPKPKSLIVQPSMWGHTVLTLEGPSFVSGWEASCPADTERLRVFSAAFATGIGVDEQTIVRELPQGEQSKVINQLGNDCGDLFRRELELGPITSKASNRGRKPKRTDNLRTSQIAKRKKNEAKEGWNCHEFISHI